jgi:hydroxymethylpyrimidine/phosphomethylpyrimidine kinase
MVMEKKMYIRALTIAGSDSGGGAGIQADLKTFSALGCYGMSVITALTAQNTVAVKSIQAADSGFVGDQIDAILEDIGVDTIKIGMLFSADIIRVVADKLAAIEIPNIVLDPVMVAKSGDKLLKDDAIEAMVELLFPLAKVITPNIEEIKVLTGLDIKSVEDFPGAAQKLFETGAENILLKGGHLESADSTDYLFIRKGDSIESFHYPGERINTKNTHGTGCTYSSAIAAYLGQDCRLNDAIKFAKQYISGAIEDGARYQLGSGYGPLNHFYDIWNR